MKPDFIGIGAARGGTTWLFRQLEQHADVWLPRIKELHYFTRSTSYSGPSHLATDGRLPRLFRCGPAADKYRVHFFRAAGSNLLKPSWRKLRWDVKYLCREPGIDWYRSLFDDAGDRCAGEITPRYSIMTRWDIQRLRAELPRVKVFFIMRDPVERIWSLIKYHEKRWYSGLTEQPWGQLIEQAFDPAKVTQSDYETILANWRSVFPESHFFTCFFDQIVDEPKRLSDDLCDFLGIARLDVRESEAKVNASSEKEMPRDLRRVLIDYYRPMVRRLSDREGGYFTKWAQKYESVVSDTTPNQDPAGTKPAFGTSTG